MANKTDPGKIRRATDRPAELVIITGLSGSGKGSVLKALEDLGYYSVDNLPVDLIPKFAELTQDSASVRAAALVVDVREGEGLSWTEGVAGAVWAGAVRQGPEKRMAQTAAEAAIREEKRH